MKCLHVAQKAMDSGDLGKAERFLNKAKNMGVEDDDLIQAIQAARAGESGNAQRYANRGEGGTTHVGTFIDPSVIPSLSVCADEMNTKMTIQIEHLRKTVTVIIIIIIIVVPLSASHPRQMRPLLPKGQRVLLTYPMIVLTRELQSKRHW